MRLAAATRNSFLFELTNVGPQQMADLEKTEFVGIPTHFTVEQGKPRVWPRPADGIFVYRLEQLDLDAP